MTKVLPKYPAWCLQKGISGVVKVRIWVEASGSVREGTLVEISSGYPDLDQAVVNALKKWRFAPLPKNVVQETQWGIITFRFVCG
jgi:protein TonB